MANSKHKITDTLVVDTGASHVLLRQQHAHLFIHVQWSSFNQAPYAMLRAANGQILNAVGRGMLTVQTITVIAYIFRDDDLVHNLLGIAPFADRECKAVFTAKKFTCITKISSSSTVLDTVRACGILSSIRRLSQHKAYAPHCMRTIQNQFCSCTKIRAKTTITYDSFMHVWGTQLLPRSFKPSIGATLRHQINSLA